MRFSNRHRVRIRIGSVFERLNRGNPRRTYAVGTFPDGRTALMLVCVRLRYAAETQWAVKAYA